MHDITDYLIDRRDDDGGEAMRAAAQFAVEQAEAIYGYSKRPGWYWTVKRELADFDAERTRAKARARATLDRIRGW